MLIFWIVLAIAGTSTAAIAIFCIGSSCPQTEQYRQNQQDPGNDSNTAGNIETKPSEQYSNYWPRIEKRVQQQWDKFINDIKRDDNDKIVVAIATIVIALFTGMLFFSNIFLFISGEKSANAAKKSAEVAERALIAGQRPFVSVTAPIIEGGLTWEEKGARTTILFSIKNVGKSPAFDISVQADQFVMGRDKPDVNTELRKFCAAVRRQRLLPLAKGDVLFPNETLSQRHGLLFIRAEIETNAKCNGAFFTPIVLICVDYRSSVTERRHTTGLVYDLFQWTTEGAKLVPIGEAVQALFLSLARSPEGSFAD